MTIDIIDPAKRPTFDGERLRHLDYFNEGEITEDQYDRVCELLYSVEDGRFTGDYGQLMTAYREIIPPPPHLQADEQP